MACGGIVCVCVCVWMHQFAALAAASSQECFKDAGATSWLQTRWDLDMQGTHSAGPTEICIAGYAAPQFYLLGAQKAGTSTLSFDLMTAGVVIGSEDPVYYKEVHAFDQELQATLPEWHAAACSVGDEANASEVIQATRAITYADATISGVDLSAWRPCSAARQDATLADMTPDNLRLPSGPRLFANLYADAKKDLRFAIALREPITRWHSGFYHEKKIVEEYSTDTIHRTVISTCRKWSFAEYVEQVIPLAKASALSGFDDLEHDVFLDQFYRSMYSLNIEPWLKAFQPSQFVIIPMGRYFQDIHTRQATMETLRDRLGVKVHPQKVQYTSVANPWDHPDLAQDLDNATLAALNEDFFGPDTKRLAEMLATALTEGLVIDGYEGIAEASSIEQFLRLNW